MEDTTFRIAIIDPVGSKAGMDHYNNMLATGIQNNGSEAVVFSNYATAAGLTVYPTFQNTGKNKYASLISSFAGMVRSIRFAKKWGANRILLHVFRGGFIDMLYFVMVRVAGLRIVAIVHDVESLETYSLPLFRRIVIGRLADTRIVHNTFSKEQLLRILGNSHRFPVFTMPHVHFLDLFENNKTNVPELTILPIELDNDGISGIVKLLFFGQIKRSKGLDLLLEAMHELPEHIHLVIAGKTRDTDEDSLLKFIQENGLTSRVKPILRHISDPERDALFESCDILVLPYRRIYQSGVLLMAMSAGIPVVASDLEPNRDAVIHKKTGLLFQRGNTTDLCNQINLLSDDAAMRRNLSAAARDHIRVHYDPLKAGRDLIFALSKP
ncbi:MAG: glycosyltransferase family 4 protein [Bacteroidota bacterium]